MKYMRLVAILLMGALTSLIFTPTAVAHSEQCDKTVIATAAETVFDENPVADAARMLQHASRAELYIRGVDTLTPDHTASVYNDEFRAECNPATDYILIVVGGNATRVFYGSHFDRLIPVIEHVNAKRYYAAFYAAGSDKTAAIITLLNDLRMTFEQNPDHANYVAHPVSYLAVGYVNDAPVEPPGINNDLVILIVVSTALVVGIIVAITIMVRDKTDHRWN